MGNGEYRVTTKDVHWVSDVLLDLKFDFVNYKRGRFSQRECRNIMTFDIETSNGFYGADGKVHGFNHRIAREQPEYYKNCKKASLMYVWQFAIEQPHGKIEVFMGRTWEQFNTFLEELNNVIRVRSEGFNQDFSGDRAFFNDALEVAKEAKNKPTAHIYIHNLGFEFQHLRNLYEVPFSRTAKTVFSRTKRKPMKVKFTAFRKGCTFELNDTLVLTQKSLAQWGKDGKFPVQKLKEPKGFYLPIRTPETPLDDEMINYCINDVVTMVYGVRQYRDQYKELWNIPMTQTGQVRRVCDANITQKNPTWANWCQELAKDYSYDDYVELMEMFVGGSTHASGRWADMILHNLRCFDFASSYPAVMTTRKFPVGKFEACSYEECEKIMRQPLNDRSHCFYIKAKLSNVQSKRFNTFWSFSKSREVPEDDNLLIDNGKISSCTAMEVTMTDLDWDVFNNCYDFDIDEVIECRKATADYLPKEMILTILGYYGQKTSLKDVGRDSEYNEAKQFVNSIYGCCVTRVISDEIMFQGGWVKDSLSPETYEERKEKATKKAQFVCYQLGVWVTAWARHNLWDGILHFDEEVVYYDTDSLKGFFDDAALDWFNEYNVAISELCKKVATHYGFDVDMYAPKTPEGKSKPLGYFAREDDAIEFRTLGAKRYCYTTLTKKEKDYRDKITVRTKEEMDSPRFTFDDKGNSVHVTVAGLPKSAGKTVHSVQEFTEDLTWSTEESEKLGACYCDDQPELDWVDESGNEFHSKDTYGLCLMPVTFEMSVSDDYKTFCDIIKGNTEDYDYFAKAKIFRDL